MATAWGDESVRKTGVPSPMYLMGACVCDDTETETRQRLALLKPKGARKLHWRDMRPSLRGKVVDAMAAMDIDHVIVAAVPMSQWNTAERARRKCLERLLPLLETRDFTGQERYPFHRWIEKPQIYRANSCRTLCRGD